LTSVLKCRFILPFSQVVELNPIETRSVTLRNTQS